MDLANIQPTLLANTLSPNRTSYPCCRNKHLAIFWIYKWHPVSTHPTELPGSYCLALWWPQRPTFKAWSPTCATIGRLLEHWGASGKKIVAWSLPLKDTETLVPSFLPRHQEVSSLLCHELPAWWTVLPWVHHSRIKWQWTNISETMSKNRSFFLVDYYFIISVKANKHTHLLQQVFNILPGWELRS